MSHSIMYPNRPKQPTTHRSNPNPKQYPHATPHHFNHSRQIAIRRGVADLDALEVLPPEQVLGAALYHADVGVEAPDQLADDLGRELGVGELPSLSASSDE